MSIKSIDYSTEYHFNLKDYDDIRWTNLRQNYLYGILFLEQRVNLHIYVDNEKLKEEIIQFSKEHNNINLIMMEE